MRRHLFSWHPQRRARVTTGHRFGAGASLLAAPALLAARTSHQVVTGPVATYWLNADTSAGLGAMAGGGIGGVLGMLAGRSPAAIRTLDLQLGSSRTPAVAKLGLVEAMRSMLLLDSRSIRMPHGPSFGSSRTDGAWPNERDTLQVPAQASLRGEHRVEGDDTPDMSFTVERHGGSRENGDIGTAGWAGQVRMKTRLPPASRSRRLAAPRPPEAAPPMQSTRRYRTASASCAAFSNIDVPCQL